MKKSNTYALILAGGSGEHFWPLSRKSKPKQLLKFFSGTTLLEAALDRLTGLIPNEHILILTNCEQESSVRELLPQFPKENILAEPTQRDTAAAVALAAAWVALRDHSATMVVLPADHLIKDKLGFQNTLMAAVAAAARGGLVTIGIKPKWACPGFGYIELGEKVDRQPGSDIHKVVRFREKPNPELAESFIQAGNFRWNAGMYVWQLPAILSAFERHAPELAAFIARIHETRDLAGALTSQFATLPKISIDYAVIEKASRVLEVEADFDWDDPREWTAISKYLSQQENGNSGNCKITNLDSANNIAFSGTKKHVAFLGVNDLILVETKDAILVCRRDQAEKIKQLVAQIPIELQ